MSDDVIIVKYEDDVVEIQGSAKKTHTLGLIDQFSRPIDQLNELLSCVKRVCVRILMMFFLSVGLMRCTHTWLAGCRSPV